MILAIDIGNSNIDIGVYDQAKCLFVSRILTEANKTEVEYAVLIHHILRLHHLESQKIAGAIISSVVPPLSAILKKAVQLTAPIEVLMIGPGIKTGLNIRIDNPAQLGADFVATAIGTIEKYALPAIVIDLGTATKISLLDAQKTFLGGSIMPGVMISLDALSSRAAQLPHISLEEPVELIGTNTIDCMKSGVILGTASMLDGMINRYEEKLGPAATVVACGGLVNAVVPFCKHKITIDDNLLLDGLYAIYRRNVKV